jgi:hypothetical protein
MLYEHSREFLLAKVQILVGGPHCYFHSHCSEEFYIYSDFFNYRADR